MRIRFHYIRNADFVSRMEEVKKWTTVQLKSQKKVLRNYIGQCVLLLRYAMHLPRI